MVSHFFCYCVMPPDLRSHRHEKEKIGRACQNNSTVFSGEKKKALEKQIKIQTGCLIFQTQCRIGTVISLRKTFKKNINVRKQCVEQLHLKDPTNSKILFQQDLSFLVFFQCKGPETSVSVDKSVLLETVADLDCAHQ